MSGLPNRRKAIALNAISSPTDSVIYPSGSYCIPPGTDQEVLVVDSSTTTGFSWQYVPDWNESSASLTGIKTLQFVSGALLSPALSGAVEYDGVDIYYTTDTGVRRNVTARPFIQVYSSSSQYAINTTSENIISYTSASYSSYIELSSSTKLKVSYGGLYNIQFSIQFTNLENNIPHNVDLWFKKDGSNLPDSLSEITVPGQHSSGNGQSIMSLNLYEYISSGSYIELAWRPDNVNIFLEALPTASSPARPKAPSVIVTMNKVDYI